MTSTLGSTRVGVAPAAAATSSQRTVSCWKGQYGTQRSGRGASGVADPAVTRAPRRSSSALEFRPPPCICTARS